MQAKKLLLYTYELDGLLCSGTFLAGSSTLVASHHTAACQSMIEPFSSPNQLMISAVILLGT